ncbi:hypothetical protein [Roseibium polysiphoniae]|uniref:DUF883 domain-containing protein n=1 Tax=Roseibium polysiphoniae TaxID=2571221 RepID=A0ABR9C9L1_9HYPH|nr:hypothetical protein [Roseibium polysiphoniae]MBD8875586.1 hypothetical protein [Roseibium polysiphoniae]
MATSRDLQDEIRALKAETTAPKRRRKRQPASKAAAKATKPAGQAETEDAVQADPQTSEAPHIETSAEASTEEKFAAHLDLTQLSEQLSTLVESAEHEIQEHPVRVVLGAFALGIIVGAALRR